MDLAEAGVSKHIVAAMRAYATHEALQFTGCEVLGLLANHYYLWWPSAPLLGGSCNDRPTDLRSCEKSRWLRTVSPRRHER